MPLPKEKIAEEWFKKASDDECAVRPLLQHAEAPLNIVGFHCQQMAEKYLKAFLISHKEMFPKVHALDLILQLCAKVDRSFEELKSDAVFLNHYYIDTRYSEQDRIMKISLS